MGGISSKNIEYSVMVKQSENDNETGIYRHPKQTEQLREGLLNKENVKVMDLQKGFLSAVKHNPKANCIGSREEGGKEGQYVFKCYQEVKDAAVQIGHGILAYKMAPMQDTGLRIIGVYGKNCEDWVLSDLAANLQGITTVAIYDTLGAESMAFILQQTNLSTLFLAPEMLAVLIKQDKHPGVCNLVYFDQFNTPSSADQQALEQKGYSVYSLSQVREKGKNEPQEEELPELGRECISTISYTSGTTGNPKGVMLSHYNITSTIGGLDHEEFSVLPTDVHLSYLPLAHIFERLVTYACLMTGAQIGMYSGDVQKLKNDLGDLKPTIFASVPRLYNRFYDVIKGQFDKLSGMQKMLVQRGLKKKLCNFQHYCQLTHSIYDRLIFYKTKQVFGGRVRIMVTASAPIAQDVLDFLRVTTCCPILEGYGQTESTGGSYLTRMSDSSGGHVGGPMPGVEFKIQGVGEMDYRVDDKDDEGNVTPRGELLIRGTGVFVGYYKDQAKTDEAIDKQGWLATGDIVRLNPNGTISIIDRKKNIFKLAQGEYVAAEKLEIGYRMVDQCEEVFIYGDSLQAFLVVIVFPNENKLRQLGAANNINLEDKSFAEVIEMEEMKELMLKQMGEKAKELKFNGIERPKKIHMIPKSFAEYDCQTTSFKLKRHEAKKTFIKEINAMYGI